jgi:hypothetical protein
MPRVCFPVGWSSLRTTETSAPRATSLRFRPSMKLTPFTASSKTSFGLHITIIHRDNKIIPTSGLMVNPLPIRRCPKYRAPTRAWTPCDAHLRSKSQRGTAEQWIEEGKQAAHWTRLSCHRFPVLRAGEAYAQTGNESKSEIPAKCETESTLSVWWSAYKSSAEEFHAQLSLFGDLQDFTHGWGNFLKKVAATPLKVFNFCTTPPMNGPFVRSYFWSQSCHGVK